METAHIRLENLTSKKQLNSNFLTGAIFRAGAAGGGGGVILSAFRVTPNIRLGGKCFLVFKNHILNPLSCF